MEEVVTTPETAPNRDFGYIPHAIMLMAFSLIVGLVPYLRILAFLAAFASVIIVLIERGKMNVREKRPMYTSIALYIVVLIVLVAVIIVYGISYFLSYSTTNPPPSSVVQEFVRAIVPVIIGATVVIEFTYVLYPYGLANRTERYLLWAGALVSTATSSYILLLLYNGVYTLSSIPNASSALYAQSSLGYGPYGGLLALPGLAIFFAAYMLTGIRLYWENEKSRVRVHR